MPGIFAGLFVAAPAQLAEWDLGGLTPSDWPAVEFKRLDSVKLGTLEAILTHRRYEALAQDEFHGPVRVGGPDGPWIMSVRQALALALADLTPDGAALAAVEWADTDELKLRPTDRPRPRDIADLTTLLKDMATLARQSRQDGKPMFLMMSL